MPNKKNNKQAAPPATPTIDPVAVARQMIAQEQQERADKCAQKINAILKADNCAFEVVMTEALGNGNFHYEPAVKAL